MVFKPLSQRQPQFPLPSLLLMFPLSDPASLCVYFYLSANNVTNLFGHVWKWDPLGPQENIINIVSEVLKYQHSAFNWPSSFLVKGKENSRVVNRKEKREGSVEEEWKGKEGFSWTRGQQEVLSPDTEDRKGEEVWGTTATCWFWKKVPEGQLSWKARRMHRA